MRIILFFDILKKYSNFLTITERMKILNKKNEILIKLNTAEKKTNCLIII